MIFHEPDLKYRFAFDTETRRIGPGAVAPEMICLSSAWKNEAGTIEQALEGNDEEGLARIRASLKAVLENPEVMIIGLNLAYDMAVVWHRFPDLGPLIFQAYADGRCYCCIIGDKLIAVSNWGEIDFQRTPDGSNFPRKYHMDSLAQRRLGKTRTADKVDPNSWRLNYHLLSGKPASEYPTDAKRYALEDAYDTLLIADSQLDEGSRDATYNSVRSARFRAWVDFSYFLVTIRGMRIQPDKAKSMSEAADAIAAPENLPLLVSNGYLKKAIPPQPYARGTKNPDGTPKMKKAVPEKFAQNAFRLYVIQKCMQHQLEVKLTDTGKKVKILGKKKVLGYDSLLQFLSERKDIDWEKYKKPSANLIRMVADARVAQAKAVLEQYPGDPSWTARLQDSGGDLHMAFVTQYVAMDAEATKTLAAATGDPLLKEYALRASVDKLRTTVFPNVLGHSLVHPDFDYPKQTMRASGKVSRLYPSIPVHQMPRQLGGIDPREMVIPRDGYVFIDADYSALELCTAAQTTWNIFKNTGVRCVLRELINQGIDSHSWLGSRYAFMRSPEVRSYYNLKGANDHDSRYKAFLGMANDPSEEVQELFDKWRTYAKPNGLGFWGGLGALTMVEFSAVTYDIFMSVDEAKENKRIWMEALPEAKAFFQWANSQKDAHNAVLGKTDDGRNITGYAYETPLGATRRGCNYTEFCNGIAMQSPAADGFNLGLCWIQRECYDPTRNSVLYGSGVVVPFHDQNLLEAWAPSLDHARKCAARLEYLMVLAMQQICPDVAIRCEPLMCTAWSKKAKTLKDDQGNLIPWMPKEAA